MIIESLFGLILNVIVADNTTGQAVSKTLLMYNRLERGKVLPKEEVHQLAKDTILEQGENNDN